MCLHICVDAEAGACESGAPHFTSTVHNGKRVILRKAAGNRTNVVKCRASTV